MVFNWSPSDSRSLRVSWTLLSILADLNNAVVWMVSIPQPISNSSSSPTKPLVTVPSPPITIDIILTLIFHNFFSSQAGSKSLSLFSLSFYFVICRDYKVHLTAGFLALLLTTRSGFLCISISQTILCVSFSSTYSCLNIYHLVEWSTFSFLHNSQWIIFLNHSCLLLYSLYASLLHLLLW